MKSSAHTDQRGIILVGALIVTLFFMVTSLAVAEMGSTHYSNARRTLIAASATNAADAGADAFMYQINQSSTYQGTNNAPASSTNSCTGYTSSPVTLINNSTQGKITYESCVSAGSVTNEKIVYTTGKVYLPSTSTSPKITRKLRLTIFPSNTGTSYTVQTGNGGLTMSNNASVGSGDFYINGRLKMSNSSSIGDASGVKSSRVWVAGMGCGSGATYPQICPGTTGQADLPIYISNPAHIYADVHAPNETGGGSDGSGTRSRMTNGGLIDGNATALPLPDDNRSTVMGRNVWTSKAASTANCSSGNSTTWTAGTHFTGGNVAVDKNCVVTVTGDVWIDGGLSMTNSATLKVAGSATVAPNILIDGAAGFAPINNTSLLKNVAGIAFQIRTFWSSAGTCSVTCPVPAGTQLQSSQAASTIQLNNAFTSPGATFYAVYSAITVNNGTNIGQLIGQQINLANSGTITFSGGAIQAGTPSNWNVTHYEPLYR